MLNIKYKTIRNVAIVVALLLAPVLSYGSAYMLYLQIDRAQVTSEKLVQVPIKSSSQLSEELKAQISAAIDELEPRS